MSNPGSLTAADLMRQLGFRFPAAATPALQATTASQTPVLVEKSADPVSQTVRPAPARRMLHVTNGDIAAELIRLSGISGEVSVTADVLHEGPAPGGLPPERWRKVRARYLAESGHDDYESALAALTRWDRTLEDYRSHDEVILWFEHDLFDQLLLIRILDGFAGRNLGGTELSMICIGEFPGVVPFYGLGQLTPPQMASLLPRRQRVNEGQKLLAHDAWRAFCAPDPAGLEAILQRDTSPLPFLASALRRHLEELPWVSNGLSRSERQILRGLAEGASTFEELFRATQRMEERVYMGDASFLQILRGLASPPRPLVRVEPAPSSTVRAQRVGLTTTGREVLEGRDDWVRIHGIDRWLGGVHLHGSEAAWRWDGESGRAVRM
ncbi:MAG TPA: DUF1835 domain-containing protein [Thermoanaerobaculia bacterium]|jgi:hypothetical protein|nr:DUF1835 domain-containing protein [Thermoanaerobaculia bacterium]